MLKADRQVHFSCSKTFYIFNSFLSIFRVSCWNGLQIIHIFAFIKTVTLLTFDFTVRNL